MNSTEQSKDKKSKNFRDSKKVGIQEQKNYPLSSNEQAIKHIKIMSGFRPSSEMPGNDR